jgi:hypothetical protein
LKKEIAASFVFLLLFVSMSSTFQNIRSPFLVSVSAAVPSRLWNHNGLFWDPEYLSYVRAHLSVRPWSRAWEKLQMAADESLAVTPQPIRGAWYVPELYHDRAGYHQAVLPLDESAVAMLQSANAYLITREDKYALKVGEIADAWTGSLMLINGDQARADASWYLQTMAVAAEMVNQFQGWNQSRRQAFIDWQVNRAHYLISVSTFENNLSYWLACQAMAVGILAENAELFDFAVRVFKGAIYNDIESDGHMPKETARGYRGIHYQNFAIEPLMFLAEMARHQGVDLYSYQVGNVNLKLAVDYLFKYLDAPEKWPWSSAKQDLSGIPYSLGWIEFAYHYWRDPTLVGWLYRYRPIFDTWCGGMTTLTQGFPSADEARSLVDEAGASIGWATSQTRTQGLGDAQVLFQQAGDALKAGNYTDAIDLALRAENAAERATKPTSTVTVTQPAESTAVTQTTPTARVPTSSQTLAIVALVGIAACSVVALTLRTRRKTERLNGANRPN